MRWEQNKYYIHRSLNNYLKRGIYFGTTGSENTWINQIKEASNSIIQSALGKTQKVPQSELTQLSNFGSEILSATVQVPPTAQIGQIQKKIEEEINKELDNGEKLLDHYSMRSDKMTGEVVTKTMTADDDARYKIFIEMRNELYNIQTEIGGSKKITLDRLRSHEHKIRTLAQNYEAALLTNNNFLMETKNLLMQKRPANGFMGDIKEVWQWMKLGLGYPSTNLARGDLAEMVAAYAAQKLYMTKEAGLKEFERVLNNDPNIKVQMTGKDSTPKQFKKFLVKNGDIILEDVTINSANKADIVIRVDDKINLGMSVKNVSFSEGKSPWVHLLDGGNLQNVLGPELFFHFVQLYTSKANKLGGNMTGISNTRKNAYPYFKKVMLAQALIGTGFDSASIMFINSINKTQGVNSVQAIHIPTLIINILYDDDLVTSRTSVQINGKYYTGNAVLFSSSYSKNDDPEVEMQQRVAAAITSAQDATISHSIALSTLFK